MKTVILFMALSMFKVAWAQTPVSITQFVNKSGDSVCRYQYDWWRDHLGDGFREMLAHELTKSAKVQLYERETIRQIYDEEHDLVNSDEDTSIAKGKFKKAKYTIVGAVTEFEYCAEKKGGSVNVGAIASFFGAPAPDISVGMGRANAKLVIDVRLIDVATGRVIKTVRAEGKVTESKFAVDTELGDFSSQEKSPMGQAARQAIEKASQQLLIAI